MKAIYAFDVDGTLEISAGPIKMAAVRALAASGRETVVGICGNWAVLVRADPGWFDYISFLGPMAMTTVDFLHQLSQYLRDADAPEFVMVGNEPIDAMSAHGAGWRYLDAGAFAAGAR